MIVAEERMSYFVVGLTNEHPDDTPPVYKQYRYVQYDRKMPAGVTGWVTIPPSDVTYRFVVIQHKLNRTDIICLSDVKVFVRGTIIMSLKSLKLCIFITI